MRVTRLRTYPVKSLAGHDISSGLVNPWGLDQDRRWGLVDEAGNRVTAREHNQLLGLEARAFSDSRVQLLDRNGDVMDVDMSTGGDTIAVNHRGQGTAVLAPAAVNTWLSARTGAAVRLIWQPDPGVRPVDVGQGGQTGDVMSLADAGPLLLVSESSLRQFDGWTSPDTEPMDVVRFRPNIIIDGEEPFAEEGWTHVSIDDVKFRVTMICDRCVMTTIDPSTLNRGKEPIRSLAIHRGRDNKTWFGILLTPLTRGRIHVGDPVNPFIAAA